MVLRCWLLGSFERVIFFVRSVSSLAQADPDTIRAQAERVCGYWKAVVTLLNLPNLLWTGQELNGSHNKTGNAVQPLWRTHQVNLTMLGYQDGDAGTPLDFALEALYPITLPWARQVDDSRFEAHASYLSTFRVLPEPGFVVRTSHFGGACHVPLNGEPVCCLVSSTFMSNSEIRVGDR